MAKKLDGAVVVITGASSGIGRATARAFAARGAKVVLAARREHLLDEVARECEHAGGRALVVPTDVTDPDAVDQLAARAVSAFERIDVWVNNAAVSSFGRFEDTPCEVFRRVIEVNVLGYAHGMRAVLPHFRRQGRGVLIQTSSVLARVTQPYMSSYITSKHAIQALSASLRHEVAGTDIHVCTVLPASIDTPLWQHSANYTGRVVEPPPPLYAARHVADTIVSVAQRPRRIAYAGGAGRLIALHHTLTPAISDRMIRAITDRVTIRSDRAPITHGNLFTPMTDGSGADGGWARRGRVLRAFGRMVKRLLRGDGDAPGEPTRLASGA